MLSNEKHRQAGQSIFMSSLIGLANVLAFVAAFLGTPVVYGKTILWVQDYTARHYGYGFEDIVALCWFVACGFLVFFVARTSISTALVFGGIAIMTRFF